MNNLDHRVQRIEPINTAVQRCARESNEFALRLKIVGENRGEMFLVTQDTGHKGFFC